MSISARFPSLLLSVLVPQNYSFPITFQRTSLLYHFLQLFLTIVQYSCHRIFWNKLPLTRIHIKLIIPTFSFSRNSKIVIPILPLLFSCAIGHWNVDPSKFLKLLLFYCSSIFYLAVFETIDFLSMRIRFVVLLSLLIVFFSSVVYLDHEIDFRDLLLT